LIGNTDLVDDKKEPVFIPENTRTQRNGNIFLAKHDIVSRFCFKTFDYFSNTFLKCFKLNIFEEKL